MAPLLSGALTTEELRRRLLARNFKGSVNDAVALAEEVQRTALAQGLRPSLRTHYLRTAFQKTGDASVRMSLDTDLCMSIESCGPDEWLRSAPLTSLAQLTHFPHAVLEYAPARGLRWPFRPLIDLTPTLPRPVPRPPLAIKNHMTDLPSLPPPPSLPPSSQAQAAAPLG